MHKNSLWLSFLGALLLLVTIFGSISFYKVWDYTRLDAITSAEKIDWSIVELKRHSLFELIGFGDELFTLRGEYSFRVGENIFLGSTTLTEPLFRNLYAVEEELISIRTKPAKVWYDSSNPSYSSLQKKFPFKECLSTAIMLGLLLYFIWIGYKVGRY